MILIVVSAELVLDAGNLSESEYMEELISRSPGWDAITAKMSLAVDLNGKGPTKVNGTLRMVREEPLIHTIGHRAWLKSQWREATVCWIMTERL